MQPESSSPLELPTTAVPGSAATTPPAQANAVGRIAADSPASPAEENTTFLPRMSTVRYTGLSAGVEVGGYRLVRRLGSGGMGVVWEAADGQGLHVAMKILHPQIAADPDARRRLLREARAGARLKDAHVAQVLDVEVGEPSLTDGSDDLVFVVTQLIDGVSLQQEIETAGVYNLDADLRDFVDLAHGLQEALTAVHAAGVIHRDLKPANVMLSDVGPVLIDFGIAQAADDSRLTRTGQVTGTLGFIPPQMLDGGQVDVQADWYACAGVLLFALTGVPPFGVGSWQVVLQRVYAGKPDLGDLPQQSPVLARAFTAALAPQVEERLSFSDLVQVLDVLVDEADPQIAAQVLAECLPQAALPATCVYAADLPAYPPRAQEADTELLAGTRVLELPTLLAVDAVADSAPLAAPGELQSPPTAPAPLPPAAPANGAPLWAPVTQNSAPEPAAVGDNSALTPELTAAGAAPPTHGGVMLVAWLAVAALGLWQPVLSVVLLWLATWLGGTCGRALVARRWRYLRRGYSLRSDTSRMWLLVPFYLLRAFVASVLALLCALIIGAGVLYVMGLSNHDPWGGTALGQTFSTYRRVGIAGGVHAAVVALVLWWVPWGESARTGTRRLVDLGVHYPAVKLFVVLALLAVAGGLGLLFMLGILPPVSGSFSLLDI